MTGGGRAVRADAPPHCRPLRSGIREAAHGQSRQSDGLRRADAPGAALARRRRRPSCLSPVYGSPSPRRPTISRARPSRSCICTCRRPGWRPSSMRVMTVAALGTLVWRHPARRRGAEGGGAARRGVHLHLPRHRLALGQADVGHLLGVGRAPDLGAGAVHSLSRPHRAMARDRRSGPRGARRRRS